MAKKSTQMMSDKSKPKKPTDVQFVNYDLTVEDKKRFKEWAHENAGMPMFEMLDQIVEAGFNVSCKYSLYEGCHVCFIIATPEKEALAGWILPGRGSTAFSAMAGAIFRHFILFEGTWPIREDVRRGMDDDF